MLRYTYIAYLLVSRCPLICVQRLIEQICLVRLLQFYAVQDTNELSCLERALRCDTLNEDIFLPRVLAVVWLYSDNSSREPPSDLWIKYLSTASVMHRLNINQSRAIQRGKVRLNDWNHVCNASSKAGTFLSTALSVNVISTIRTSIA
jgi:hypothetical protein